MPAESLRGNEAAQAGVAGDSEPLDIAAYTDAVERLLKRGVPSGDVNRVRRAVVLSESTLPLTRPGEANHAAASANTARALIAEYEMTGSAQALDRAVFLLDRAEADAPLLDDGAIEYLAVFGHVLLRDAERSERPLVAARAVNARRRALELTGKGDDAYPRRLGELAAVLVTQFRVTGSLAALEEAERYYRAAVRRFDREDDNFPGLLSNHGTCLHDLALRGGGLTAMEQAVRAHRGALAAVGPAGPLSPMVKANLGLALVHLYEETGRRSVLDEAIEQSREAVTETPEEHVDYLPRRVNLAVALQTLSERTGDPEVLDEAIGLLRDAVDRTPADHASRFKYLHDLSSALMRLAEHSGDYSGLDDAIEAWQGVVGGTPDSHPAKPGRLSALATARFMRFQSDPVDMSPLDDGIESLRDALRLAPQGHALRPMLQTNLSALLLSRSEHAGDRDALREAVRLSREAESAAPPDGSDRGMYLSNLGLALVQQARLSDNPSDARDAIAVLERALNACSRDDPGRARALIAMGGAQARAFELGDSRALALGTGAFREAAAMETAPSAVRIWAGREGGRLAASGGDTAGALEAFAGAVRLIEDAAWAGLRQADQQRALSECNGLPMDAAAMAIETGHPELAVELLEQGRGVLLARQLEAPGLHDRLQAAAPNAADELAWIDSELDSAAMNTDQKEPTARNLAERRSRLARQRASLLQQLRSQSGLQDLTGPPGRGILLAADSGGPVVIVNVSDYRCDALIVAGGQARPVRLGMTLEEGAEQVAKLLEAADTGDTRQVDEVLRWSWDRITGPIIAELGIAGPPPAGEETHIWWCPTGLAAFLPLHAAGGYRNEYNGHCALELAVSSYTPSLRTLIQLRQRQPITPEAQEGPLIVAMPKTPGQKDLESTEAEAADITRRFPTYELLAGPTATRESVAQAMRRHSWAHFACHGSQDLLRPYRGALHVYDGPLTITQIMRLELPGCVLAYLSACETSRGSTAIPDEGITLASALQIAGYQHVIAALWQISGVAAVDIARHLYDQIVTVHDGVPSINVGKAAAALRAAVTALRRDSPDMPALFWAPYIHTGP